MSYKKQVYLDNAATTKLSTIVLEEMMPYLTKEYGNPSSLYALGRSAKFAIENSRNQVAKAINAYTDEIFFTCSGSESNNWAIKGIAESFKDQGNHIISSNIEHPSILNTLKQLETQGYYITYLPVKENGIVSLKDIELAITNKTILITIMTANNEIGTIQPFTEIGKIAKLRDILFHTDAVQAIGSIPLDVKKNNIDLLSISAHKFHGPKGVGALYVKRGTKIHNLIHGGHQENNYRAGTENVPGIVGMGKSIEIVTSLLFKNIERITKLRNYMIDIIQNKIPDVVLNGDAKIRLPGNINFSFKGIEGESLVLMLDMNGIAVSSGSACSSGSLNPSHVLKAIGLTDELAYGAIRFSIGVDTTKEEIDYVVEKLKESVLKLRSMY